MDDESLVTVHYAWLRSLSFYTGPTGGREVDAIRDLYCAVDAAAGGRHHDRPGDTLRAPAADAERWHAATEAFLRAMAALGEESYRASRRLYPPRGSALRRLLWELRYGLRRFSLRADRIANTERLRGEALAAYRAYRDQAGDLTACVHAARERREREERERARERREQERERERRERERRAAAMATAPGEPVWAYELWDHTSPRCFWIRLETVASPSTWSTRRGLTVGEVQTAVDEDRLYHPYTMVAWERNTESALVEWHGAGRVEDAWQALTGVPIVSLPRRPGERVDRPRSYGPSSNYWSPGGFSF